MFSFEGSLTEILFTIFLAQMSRSSCDSSKCPSFEKPWIHKVQLRATTPPNSSTNTGEGKGLQRGAGGVWRVSTASRRGGCRGEGLLLGKGALSPHRAALHFSLPQFCTPWLLALCEVTKSATESIPIRSLLVFKRRLILTYKYWPTRWN